MECNNNAAGTVCNDNNACTGGDHCDGFGTCVGTATCVPGGDRTDHRPLEQRHRVLLAVLGRLERNHRLQGTPTGGVKPMTRTDHRLGDNFLKNHPWVGGKE